MVFPIFFHSSLQFVIMSDSGAFVDLNQCQWWRRWHDISYCFASLSLWLMCRFQYWNLKIQNIEFLLSISADMIFIFYRYEIVITWSFNSCVCSFKDILLQDQQTQIYCFAFAYKSTHTHNMFHMEKKKTSFMLILPCVYLKVIYKETIFYNCWLI